MKKLIKYTCFLLLISLLIPFTLAQDETEYEHPGENIALYEVDEEGNLILIEGEELEDHYDIWAVILLLTPQEYLLTRVHTFRAFDDLETLGAVFDHGQNDWEFSMDTEPEDGYDDIPYTIIHEFAHILSFDTDTYTAFTPDQDVEAAFAACVGTIVFEGCLMPESYMAQFVTEFYDTQSDLYQQFIYGEDPSLLQQLYEQNPDAYVSEYAATNPDEDFAESFAHFIVLTEEEAEEYPTGQEKILWFYDQPDLVEIRDLIIQNAIDNEIELLMIDYGD
ncbi:hypothetical protein MASR2M15_06790 [Anaerolineales bacterium]